MAKEHFYRAFKPREDNFNSLQSKISSAVNRNQRSRFSKGIIPSSVNPFNITIDGLGNFSVGVGEAYDGNGNFISITDDTILYNAANPTLIDSQTPPVPIPASTGCKTIPIPNPGVSDTLIFIKHLEVVDLTATNQYISGYHHEYPAINDGYQILVTDNLSTAAGYYAAGALFLNCISKHNSPSNAVVPEAYGFKREFSMSTDPERVIGGSSHRHGGPNLVFYLYTVGSPVCKVRITNLSSSTESTFNVTPSPGVFSKRSIPLIGFQGSNIKIALMSSGDATVGVAAYWDEVHIEFDDDTASHEYLYIRNGSYEIFTSEGSAPTAISDGGVLGVMDAWDSKVISPAILPGWSGLVHVPYYGYVSLATSSRWSDSSIFGCVEMADPISIPKANYGVSTSAEDIDAREDNDNQSGTGEIGFISGSGPNVWESLKFALDHFWKRFKEHTHSGLSGLALIDDTVVESKLKHPVGITDNQALDFSSVFQRQTFTNLVKNSSFEFLSTSGVSPAIAAGWSGQSANSSSTALSTDAVFGAKSQQFVSNPSGSPAGLYQVISIPKIADTSGSGGSVKDNEYFLSMWIKVNSIDVGNAIHVGVNGIGGSDLFSIPDTHAGGGWKRWYVGPFPVTTTTVTLAVWVPTGVNVNFRIDGVMFHRGTFLVGFSPAEDFSLPVGAIIIWNGDTCPPGFAPFPALAGRLPIGAGGVLGLTLGVVSDAVQHTHPFAWSVTTSGLSTGSTEPVSHTHSVPAHQHNFFTDGVGADCGDHAVGIQNGSGLLGWGGSGGGVRSYARTAVDGSCPSGGNTSIAHSHTMNQTYSYSGTTSPNSAFVVPHCVVNFCQRI